MLITNQIANSIYRTPPFRPLNLLPAGTVGALYDPLDLYQDSAVPPVTPASATGDPIGTIVSQVSGGFNWRQPVALNKMAAGNLPRGGRRNRLNATATLSTQSVTVPALQMTLSMTGTGTITLSGVSTAGPLVGTGVNDVVSLTFTPTAGTLTCTVSGSCTLVQLETGATRTNYQDVVNAYTITESGVPTLEMPYFGGDDFAVLSVNGAGVQELSPTADFFADTGKAWGLGGAFSILGTGSYTIIAKCSGGGSAVRTFQFSIENGVINFRIRGITTTVGSGYNDGLIHTWILVWTGSAFYFQIDGTTYAVAGGVAAKESENITIGARTESAPAIFLTGFSTIDVLLGDAPSAAQIAQYMSWARNYYGSP